jgi:hypothetical protein
MRIEFNLGQHARSLKSQKLFENLKENSKKSSLVFTTFDLKVVSVVTKVLLVG